MNRNFEEYHFCKGGCQRTCTNYTRRCDVIKCIPGCICQKGYARDETGECVTIDECKQLKEERLASKNPFRRKFMPYEHELLASLLVRSSTLNPDKDDSKK